MRILCLDAGSSSLKFALYDFAALDDGHLRFDGEVETDAENVAAAASQVWERVREPDALPDAVGHRVVFGGPDRDAPVRVDGQVLPELERGADFDPLHLGPELAIVEAAMQKFPHLPQVLCFDTAFFHALPDVAKLLPLPRGLPPEIRRYGFHGLSYESVLASLGHPGGRIAIAHLGSGASLCAVRAGRPVDTTMGFSVLGGLMMETRPGDLDPGVLLELLLKHERSASDLSEMLYRESGLKGVSGLSGDMRALLAAEGSNPQAAQAIALFVHQLVKHLGAMIAAMGGLDTLVFTGGIGEHAPAIRERACAAFGYLGLQLDEGANARGDAMISSKESGVEVRIVPANENAMIARHVWTVLEEGSR
ncbi:MAG TPA: hypothetical protein VIN40_08025 [Candidatus Tyrphobacter sp.]